MKQRGARRVLSDGVIVDAAMQLADESGHVPTIRMIAAQLGCSPMALYRHVPDKVQLVALLIERVYRELGGSPHTPQSDDAADVLLRVAERARSVFAQHAWFPIAAAATPPTGRAGLDYTEMCLKALNRCGWDVDRAASALGAVMTYVTGEALLSASTSLSSEDVSQSSSRVDLSEWPLTAMRAERLEGEGDIGLEALVGGLCSA